MKKNGILTPQKYHNGFWNIRTELALLILIGITIIAVQNAPVFAISENNQKLVNSIYDGLKKVYSVLVKIVLPIAGVCVAACAFTIWLGGERGIEKAKRILLFTVIGVGVVFLTPAIIVAAHSAIKFSTALPNSALNPTPELNLLSTLSEIWSVAEKIVLPLAGVSCAYGGMCFFGIDILSQLALDKQIEKGKTIIRTTVIAVFAFYAIPTIMVIAVNTFSSNGWRPPDPTTPTAHP